MLASAGSSALLVLLFDNTFFRLGALSLLLRHGPSFLQRSLDLLPYAASKIRSVPFVWRSTAIKGNANERIARINSEARVMKAEQELKSLQGIDCTTSGGDSAMGTSGICTVKDGFPSGEIR